MTEPAYLDEVVEEPAPTPRTFEQVEAEVLAKSLPGYEPRPSQRAGAAFIEQGLRDKAKVMVQAGTGTGKSAMCGITVSESGKRTVIATATNSLLSQYKEKDMPFLEKHLGTNWALLKGISNYVCFQADTRVLTWDGAKRIADLSVDGYATVLDGEGGWTKSEVRSFGHQRLWRLVLTRDGSTKEIFTTRDHRWFVNVNANHASHVEKTTEELRVGEKLAYAGPRTSVTSSRVSPSPQGIAHGIVFGDGTNFRCATTRRGDSGTVQLMGQKKQLRHYFPLNRKIEELLPKGYSDRESVRVYDLPNSYKTLPSLDESTSYLYGWLAGLMATDGHISRGSYTISSAQREVLQHVRDVSTQLGIVTYPIRSCERIGINQTEESSLHTVTIAAETVGDDFLLREEHATTRANYEKKRTNKQWRVARRWTVVSIEETDRIEEVYCAVVPTTHSFVLEDNILTGNCQAKLAEATTYEVPNLLKLRDELDTVEKHDGDKESVATPIDPKEWRHLTVSSDECARVHCPFFDSCYSYGAKRRAMDAQVVVTNHMMLMTDAVLSESTGEKNLMLGPHTQLVIDEAHELADWARKALTLDLNKHGVENTAAELTTFMATQGGDRSVADPILQAIEWVWSVLPADGDRMRLSFFVNNSEPFIALIQALDRAYEALLDVRVVDDKRATAKKYRIMGRLDGISDKMRKAVTSADPEYVRWVTVEKRTYQGRPQEVKVFHAAPVAVAEFLQRTIWKDKAAVLVSATLKTGGDFSYVAGQVGLLDARTLDVGTNFDFPSQARLFVPPSGAPSPQAKTRNMWQTYAAETTMELVQAAGGGALLLFTSRSAMQDAYRSMADRLRGRGHTVLMQGQDGTNQDVARRFDQDEDSVLFALRSFMTGVSFEGQTCRLVVVDKLPFPVPSDPIFSAMSEQYGSQSFGKLSIPMMSLVLEQAIGRLIRTNRDHGVMAILDSRLASTGYGRGIVRSLPPARLISTVEEARAFFSER